MVNKYAKKFIESKILMNEFTNKLNDEVANITKKMDPPNLTKEIISFCKAKKLNAPREGLFAVNGGRLSTTFARHEANPTLKVVQRHSLTGMEKYENYLGAAWFYHYNHKEQLHMFYAVGGSFNSLNATMTSSSNTREVQLDFRGSITAWALDLNGHELKMKQFITGDDRLKINCPAITYLRDRGCVYIVGGITPEMKPTDAILEYNVEKNQLTNVGSLRRLRYNHTCCNYKGKIYILGGVNFNRYCDGTGTTKIRGNERISDLHGNFVESEVEIYTPGEKQTSSKPSTLQITPSHLMIRNVSVVLPCYKKDMIVLFGGNCGVRMLAQGPSIAYDMENGTWAYFGENNLHRELVVGQDMALSPHTLIVDFEGYQTENSATFMVADPSHVKTHIITFTAKGAEKTYRWVW